MGSKIFAAIALLAASAEAQTVPTGLLVDFQNSPALGVRLVPAFSWIVPPCQTDPNQQQTAYQIVVKNNVGQTLWDSGRVASNASTYVLYGGPQLATSYRYSWTVSTWTQSCTSPGTSHELY
jgi:alpha-L-rhamnosidase